MKSFGSFRFGLVLASAVCCVGGALGQTIVLPNGSAATEGNSSSSTTAGPLGTGAFTSQWLWDSSHLGAISVGTKIYGIRFRLDGANATGTNYPNASMTWANYDVTFAKAATTVTTMSANPAANMTNQVSVRSGSFTLNAASFTDSGASHNPFGGYIGFTTPYTYSGGDLVMMISHSASTGGTGVTLDVTTPINSNGYGTSYKMIRNSGYGATSLSDPSGAQVVQLDMTAPVPEPASMLALGTGILALSRRRNARRQTVKN